MSSRVKGRIFEIVDDVTFVLLKCAKEESSSTVSIILSMHITISLSNEVNAKADAISVNSMSSQHGLDLKRELTDSMELFAFAIQSLVVVDGKQVIDLNDEDIIFKAFPHSKLADWQEPFILIPSSLLVCIRNGR